MISDETLERMAKAPSTFPAHALADALEELIARRGQEYVRMMGRAATRYPLQPIDGRYAEGMKKQYEQIKGGLENKKEGKL